MVSFPLVFDDVMIKQLRKAAKNQQLKEILRNMLDELEEKGQKLGNCWIHIYLSTKSRTNIHLSGFISSITFRPTKFTSLNMR